MTYRVELIHSEEGYWVWVPELPGCLSQGLTEEEALANIRSAITDYIEVAEERYPNKIVRYVEVNRIRPKFEVEPVLLDWPDELRQTDSVADWLESLDRKEASASR